MQRQLVIPDSLDLASLGSGSPLFGPDEIRAVNPQRHEMEQLSAVVAIDDERMTAIGYKDLTTADFWGDPALTGGMPSPIGIEVAAQLAVFYLKWSKLLNTDADLGIGGLSNMRVLAPFQAPCRLMIAVRVVDLDAPYSARLEFQAEVNGTPVFAGDMLCIALRRRAPESIKPKPAAPEFAKSSAPVLAGATSGNEYGSRIEI